MVELPALSAGLNKHRQINGMAQFFLPFSTIL
jgi:hypothetical protein